MNHFNPRARMMFVTAGALFATSLLHAQTPPPEEQAPADSAATAPAPAEPTTQIADAKVDQFAAAFVAVQDIQAQASQKLSTAKDDQQATAVKTDAEKQMVEAVEHQGLQVQEFNRIAELMTTDLQLRSRVVEKVQQRRKG